MTDKTIKFSIKDENEVEMKKNLLAVYEALNEKGYNSISFREPSTQQSTWYDLSLVLGAETKYSDLAACWNSLDLAELESSKVIDTYEKDGIRSITVRLNFAAMDRTLEMDEVQGWINTVLGNLSKIGVTLRA